METYGNERWHQTVNEGNGLGRTRAGNPLFYEMLNEMADTHDRKSHDYASNDNPSGNYHFAGLLAVLFAHSVEDAGFIGRIGEKIYRLSNLEKNGRTPLNESVEDTERDIAVITLLWMADRRSRRRLANQTIYGGAAYTGKAEDSLRMHLAEEPMQEQAMRDNPFELFLRELNSMDYPTLLQLEILVRRLLSDKATTDANPRETRSTGSPLRSRL